MVTKVKKALLYPALLGLFLIVTELLLRVFWYTPYTDFRYKRDDPQWLKNNVTLNHFGYRDHETNLLKPGNVFRVYSLGTSYTFGWYLDSSDQAYPQQLGKILSNEFKNRQIEVINAARPGYSLQEKVDQLKTQGVLFSPDLVTIDLNIFDLTNMTYTPKYVKNSFIRSLYLYQITEGERQRKIVSQNIKKSVLKSLSPDTDNMKNLITKIEGLKKITDSVGSKLAIIIFPYYDPQNPDQYEYTEFHQAVKKICADRSIDTVDLLEVFKGESIKKEILLNPTDTHFSVVGNQMIADDISKTINFKKLLSETGNTIRDKNILGYVGLEIPKLQNIISIKPEGWVYFDSAYNLGTMNLLLPDFKDKKLFYIEDVLKTAKSFIHDGWPGAKIEYWLPKENKLLTIPNKLYGYQSVGVSSISAFWDDHGSLRSSEIDLKTLKIGKDEKNISVELPAVDKYQMFKITVDVAVKQFDLDRGKITEMFKTEMVTATMKAAQKSVEINLESKSSHPVGYGWVDNVQERVTTGISESGNVLTVILGKAPEKDTKIEIPVAVEINAKSGLPLVEYN